MRLPQRPESVTYVPGMNCYPSVRKGNWSIPVTVRGERIGTGLDAVLILLPVPQGGHPGQSRTRGELLSTGGRQLIAVDRLAMAAYYVGQMTYQKGR